MVGMPDRVMVDVGEDRRVWVAAWFEGDLPGGPAADPFELRWPLDDDALEDLRWYLEDYLLVPYGVYGEKGPEVSDHLRDWGNAVFETLFGSGPGRDTYMRVRARAARGCEMVFRSASSDVLGLPWELMRDPDRPSPVALDFADVTRSLPTEQLGEALSVRGERLRVLMVISRPGGAADVGYRMIARPLLDRLDAVRGSVELVVLRPPTLDALREELARALAEDRPYQLVHFDGHGMLSAAGRSTPSAEGFLVFERPGGGSDEVPAASLAQVLREGQVPVVVLNACQSGAVGKDLEVAVATRLLQEGCSSVVAMAYTVYAVAAAEFMTAFYERLFAGDTVTEAVTAGRRRLYERPERPSPKGLMPLADWLVPVHYLRRETRFPGLQTAAAPEVSLNAVLDRYRRRRDDEETNPLDPVGDFFGRDALFYELEVAARLQRVVVLHGPGGTGKTELAKAFGRWWRDTGAVEDPAWVVVHSFQPGLASFGLAGVVDAIGLRVFGADFGRLPPDERRDAVEDLLQEHRLLLIWDNFESVNTMPDPTGATPALDEEGCAELRDFVAKLAAGGKSALLITTRTTEPWLGDVRRIEVGGLSSDEAIEYAEWLLEPYPDARPRRATPAFAELLEWLDGHPLSMRLVLPHLANTDAADLLAGLQGAAALPQGPGDDRGRTTSLNGSIAYSFDHLSAEARRLIVAVSLSHGVADADVLAIMSTVPGAPDRFRAASDGSWTEVLGEVAGVGLLTPLGAGMFRVHPALPAYLAERWREEEPDEPQQRAAATRALLTAYAGLGQWFGQQIHREGNAAAAYRIIDFQRRTLGYFLGYAIEHELWPEAAALAWPLDDYLEARGLYAEANAWCDRVRVATEGADGSPPAEDTSAGQLWRVLVSAQANRLGTSGRHDEAERTYLELLQATLDQPEPHQESLAVLYHQLGIVAMNRGQLEPAMDWLRKSMAIEEALGNERGLASSYHQLGVVAHLGEQLEEAEEWYRKAVVLKEARGDRRSLASTYHQLGRLAQDRNLLDDAEHWYRETLAIEEEIGHPSGIAACYHQLGIVSHLREQLDAAEHWYRQSLAIHESLGDRPRMASNYGQLGLLAEDRGRYGDALDWIIRSISLFEFPHPATEVAGRHLTRFAAVLEDDMLEARWHELTGAPMPPTVREYLKGATV
jgi:tetratricopeptide (TPR) repeat protein